MGGKTGTAQQSKVHPDHVLFAGYAPADDPQIAITSPYCQWIQFQLCGRNRTGYHKSIL